NIENIVSVISTEGRNPRSFTFVRDDNAVLGHCLSENTSTCPFVLSLSKGSERVATQALKWEGTVSVLHQPQYHGLHCFGLPVPSLIFHPSAPSTFLPSLCAVLEKCQPFRGSAPSSDRDASRQ